MFKFHLSFQECNNPCKFVPQFIFVNEWWKMTPCKFAPRPLLVRKHGSHQYLCTPATNDYLNVQPYIYDYLCICSGNPCLSKKTSPSPRFQETFPKKIEDTCTHTARATPTDELKIQKKIIQSDVKKTLQRFQAPFALQISVHTSIGSLIPSKLQHPSTPRHFAPISRISTQEGW